MKVFFGMALTLGFLGLTTCSTETSSINVSTPNFTATVSAPTKTDIAASATPTGTIPTTPTVIPIPQSFSRYDSREFVNGTRHKVVNFSVSVPETWVAGWIIDSGITAYSIESTSRSWEDPNSVWMMIIPMTEVHKGEVLSYAEQFSSGSQIAETREYQFEGNSALSATFSDGEILTIASTIWAVDTELAVFIIGYMPHARANIYRPLVEEIISSIQIGEKNRVPSIIVIPRSGPRPTSYNFYLAEFLPEESVDIEVFQPDGTIVYQTTLISDGEGNSTFLVVSEPTGPIGTYRIVARGDDGSSAAVHAEVE